MLLMRTTFTLLALLSGFGCGDSAASTGGGAAQGGSGSGAAGTGAGAVDGGASATGGGAASGGAASGGGSPGCGIATPVGTVDATLEVGGVTRSYVLAVPVALDGSSAVPLILGFHGFGGTGQAASQYFELTGSEPAIYAYPQALPLPDQNGGIGWDMTPDGVDVAFVDALVARLEAEHCIDATRIFAAGHSHGASFSNHLGCYRPETFRAIAPVSGGGPWAGPCTSSVSAMVTHGLADMDVPIDNGIGSRDHWLEANGCTGAPGTPTEPSPCIVYDGCAEPVLWCQHDGGHEWPSFAGAGIRGFFLSF